MEVPLLLTSQAGKPAYSYSNVHWSFSFLPAIWLFYLYVCSPVLLSHAPVSFFYPFYFCYSSYSCNGNYKVMQVPLSLSSLYSGIEVAKSALA